MNDSNSLKDINGSKIPTTNIINSLTDFSKLFLFSYSPKYKSLISWSDNAVEILGVEDSKITMEGNLFLKHVHPDDRFLLLKDLEAALNGKKDYRATYRWIKPSTDEVCWIHCRAHLIEKDDEITFDGFMIDLTNEFTGSVGKIAGPDSVTSVLTALSTSVFILDLDFRILRINKKKGFDFNFGDIDFRFDKFKIGRNFLKCFNNSEKAEFFSEIFHDLIKGSQEYFKTRISLDEKTYNLEISIVSEKESISGLILSISDISESVALEKKISELQKVDGLRLMAAGMSHNFNNALQSIIGHASIIKTNQDNPKVIEEASQSIIDIVNKSSELTKQLFSLDENTNLIKEIDLNLTVMAAINKIDDLFSDEVKIDLTFGNSLSVKAKQDDVVTCVQAVLINARESLGPDGHISIHTSEAKLNDYEVNDLKAGYYSKVVVTDNGTGMPKNVKNRCLEPFYTTKVRDPRTGIGLKGEGLGLSSAFNIIKKYNGAISFKSIPGAGTAVSIYLPISNTNSNKRKINHNNDKPDILVIDDDETILTTMQAILKDLGHKSLISNNYNEAAELIKDNQSLKLILIDAVMPGTNGVSMLKKFKKLRNDIKYICFSGANSEIRDSMIEAGAKEVLKKPVAIQSLKELLDNQL